LVQERIELRGKLTGYDEPKLLALNLDLLGQKWQVAQRAWFLPKWLHITNVSRHFQTARSDQAKPDAATMGEVLKAALRLRTVNAELVAVAPKAEPLLGPIWSRGEPQLDYLIQVRAWGLAFEERLVSVVGEDTAWLNQLRTLIGSLFKQGPASYEVGTVIGNRLNRYRDAITKFDAAYEPLLTSADIRRGPLEDAADHLSVLTSTVSVFQTHATRLRAINVELNVAAPIAQDCLGILWAKGEPNADMLTRARAWGEPLHARMLACAGDDMVWLGQLRQLLASLFAEGPAVYATNTIIGTRLIRYLDTQAEFNAAFNALVSEVRLRRESLDSASDYFTAIQRVVQRIPSAWHQIREWCFWQKVRNEATKLGLSTVITKLESYGGEAMDIPSLFERSFRRELFFAVVEREDALREFFGREHNERIDRFREVDEKIAGLARELIRARLAAGIPRDQGHGDIPKSEIGLLRREIAKKMRHIPVRQLLSRIPNLLPRLKPCVLMSPLSVAQYLEPSHAIFDVVIFDEASQIPVWDAIGAIARGQQLIVVGDPKQLPPTNFFNSAGDDEDSLAPEEFKDLESILDELMSNQMRHKRLQWHYRSRHEGLITFSNRQYYENELLTFPSAEITQGGVKFKHLPEARYDKGKSRTNRGEADALVGELVARLRNPEGPRRSYGVVTFSLAQQQLVENLLDEERRKYPEIEVHFGDEPPVEGEPVFVKNLENVQGDERDVILFSICYGVDESGRVAMNFGPLNRDGGERRLNVAITRAKHEVMVFSGLRADQIDLARTRARGVRDLKYFLDYAERGTGALTAVTSASADGEADSEFERMVANRLRAAGFEIRHQVGCSGYRIDLGILDPANPGRYLLGVECDGATYHRAATARDRDKLRQHILEGLGWTLYRIWSTDWWHDSEAEIQKLISFIKDLSNPA
jgi:very-short-patch-repair endonuclease